MSPMFGRTINIFTLKQKRDDPCHSYMIVSFPESTLVMEVKDDKVTQLNNSGLVTNEQTLHVGLLQTDIQIQVTNKCLIQVSQSKERKKWENKKAILMACSNSR